MNAPLSKESFWLLATLLMTAFFWVPYILNRMREQGVLTALWDPEGETTTGVRWASRMMQAHRNAVENLVIFAPLVLLVEITGAGNGETQLAAMVYFFARATHYLVFTFGIPLLRVVSFLAGVAAQLVLLLTLLGWR